MDTTHNTRSHSVKRMQHRRNGQKRPHQKNYQSNYSNNQNHVELDHLDEDQRLDYRPPRSRVVLQQHIDKFLNLARDAMSAGDRVLSEHNLQHADHFNRLLNEQKDMQKIMDMRRQQSQKDMAASQKNHDRSDIQGAVSEATDIAADPVSVNQVTETSAPEEETHPTPVNNSHVQEVVEVVSSESEVTKSPPKPRKRKIVEKQTPDDTVSVSGNEA